MGTNISRLWGWLGGALAATLLIPTSGFALQTYTVTTTADSGAGSLRAAMAAAVTDADDSTITFTVSGTVAVGSSTNTALPLHAENFVLTINGDGSTLDGTGLPTGNGLSLLAGSLVISNLTLTHFPNNGIELDTAVSNSKIGGTSACSRGTPTLAVRNNFRSGILISGAASLGNVVHCTILENNGDDGITILNFAHDTLVNENLIYTNATNGVKVSGDAYANRIASNTVSGNSQSGILIANGAHDNIAGPSNDLQANFLDGVQVDGTGSNNNTITDNTSISNNFLHGVSLSNGATGNLVWNNTISSNAIAGIHFYGTTTLNRAFLNAISNQSYGIWIINSAANTIGAPGAANTIQALYTGVDIGGASATLNVVESNAISGGGSTPKYGIFLHDSADSNELGTLGKGNTISGFGEACINASGTGSNKVRSNALSSCSDGIRSANSTLEVIGNTISNMWKAGIYWSTGAAGTIGPTNTIRYNSIGIKMFGGTADVTGNTIYQSFITGIWVRNDSMGGQVRYNQLYDTWGGCIYTSPYMDHDWACWPAALFTDSSGWQFGPGNSVHSNPIGIVLENSPVAVVGNAQPTGGFFNNTYEGMRLQLLPGQTPAISNNDSFSNRIGISVMGGDPQVTNNRLTNNAEEGLYVETLPNAQNSYEIKYFSNPLIFPIPRPDLNAGDDRAARPTISNNTFSGQEKAIKAIESKPANFAALAAGTAGNLFAGAVTEFGQYWYGVIGAVFPDGTTSAFSTCEIVGTDISSTGASDGLCPPIPVDKNLKTYPIIRATYTKWLQVPELLRDSAGTTQWSATSPHRVQVDFSGKPFFRSYSFDGNTNNDGLPVWPDPAFNTSGRFQAATVIVYPVPSISFSNGNKTIVRSEMTAPTILVVEDFKANLVTTAVDSITAVVTDTTSGESEIITLLERGPNQGVFDAQLLFNPLSVTTNNDGVFSTQPGSIIRAVYDSIANTNALPVTADVLMYKDTSGTIMYIRNGVKTDRIVIDQNATVRVYDINANLDPLTPDILNSAVSIVNNANADAEIISLVETGPSTGIFEGQFFLEWGSSVTAGDGKIAASIGNEILATYSDPSDPTDVSAAKARASTAPFRGQMSFLDREGNPISELLPDQLVTVSLLDYSRNMATGREVITSLRSKVVKAQEAVSKSRLAAYSSLGGKILDWEPLRLKETGGASGIFRGPLLLNHRQGQNQDPNTPNGILYAPTGATVAVYYLDYDDADYPTDVTTEFRTVVGEPNGRNLSGVDKFGMSLFRVLVDPNQLPLAFPFRLAATGVAENAAKVQVETLGWLNQDNKYIGNEDLERFELHPEEKDPSLYRGEISQALMKAAQPQSGVLDIKSGIRFHAWWFNPKDPSDRHHYSGVFCDGSESYLRLINDAGAPITDVIEETPLRVRIVDSDRNTDRNIVDVVTLFADTGKDREALAAVETGPDTGVFEVRIVPVSAPEPVSNNGLLEIRVGDLITFSYQDNSQLASRNALCRFADRSKIQATVITRQRSSFFHFVDADGKQVQQLAWGGNYRIELIDSDANNNRAVTETVLVRIAAGAGIPGNKEWIELLLTEATSDNSRFVGQLQLGSASTLRSLAAHNGTLKIASAQIGDRLYAAYDDPDDPNDRVRTSLGIAFLPLKITWKLSSKTAAIGDLVRNSMTIANPNAVSVPESGMQLQMLTALKMHRKGMEHSPGIFFPASGIRTRQVGLPVMGAGATLKIAWIDAVPPGAKEGEKEGRAWITVRQTLISNREQVALQVRRDPLFEQGTLVGRVFYDENGDGWMSSYEKGVTHAVLLTSDGHKITTDKHGRFHIGPLPVGPIAVRVDPRYQPPGTKFLPPVQSVEIWPGEMSKLNFGIQIPRRKIAGTWQSIPYRRVRFGGIKEGLLLSGSLTDRFELGRNPLAWRWVNGKIREESSSSLFRKKLAGRDLHLSYQIPEYDKVMTATVELASAEGGLLGGWPFLPTGNEETATLTGAVDLLPPAGNNVGWRMEVIYKDGVRASTPLRTLRVFDKVPTEELAVASHFESGSHSLEPVTILNLRDAAELLRSFPDARVIIEGYTDNRGEPSYNRTLSQERAAKGKLYLQIVEDIDPSRITAIGYGATHPLVPNDSDAHMAQNRRVVVKVVGVPKSKAPTYKAFIRSGRQTVPVERDDSKVRILIRPSSTLMVQDSSGRTLILPLKETGLRIRTPEPPLVREPDYNLSVTISAPQGTIITGSVNAIHKVNGPAVYQIPLRNKRKISLTLETDDGFTYKYSANIRLQSLRDSDLPKGESSGNYLTLVAPPKGALLPSEGLTFTGHSVSSATLSTNRGKIKRLGNNRFTLTTGPLDGNQLDLKVTANLKDGRQTVANLHFPVQQNNLVLVGTGEIKGELYRQNQADATHPNGTGIGLETGGGALLTGKVSKDTELTLWTGAPLRDWPEQKDRILDLNPPAEGPGSLAIRERDAYITYGDDATVATMIAPLGPIFAHIRHKSSEAGWGVFQAPPLGFSLLDDNDRRAGAWAWLNSRNPVTLPWNSSGGGWLTPARGARQVDRFVAAGSSLYFLRNAPVLPGSEQVETAIVDGRTGLLRTRKQLLRGEQYRIDYDSGQVILLEPLSFLTGKNELISDGVSGTDRPVLIVRYDREINLTDAPWAHREVLAQDLGGWGRLSGYYQESRDNKALQRRTGARIEAGKPETAVVGFEWGRVFTGNQTNWISQDGGLSWAANTTGTTLAGGPANAFGGDAYIHLGSATFRSEGSYLQSGYTAGNGYWGNQAFTVRNHLSYKISDHDFWKKDWGTLSSELEHIWQRADIDSRSDQIERGSFSWKITHITTRIGIENRHGLSEHIAMAAAELRYAPMPWEAWIRHQQMIVKDRNPRGVDTRISTLGAAIRLFDKLRLDASGSLGASNWAAEAGVGWIRDSALLRLGAGWQEEIATGRSGLQLSLSGKQPVSDKLDLTAAQQYQTGDLENGWLSSITARYRLLKGLQLRSRFERGELQSAGLARIRTVAGAGGSYGSQRLNVRLDGEQRWDDLPSTASNPSASQQNIWSALRFNSGEDLYQLFTLSYSRTLSDDSSVSALNSEVGAGLGYRPINFNALDWLGMVRWLQETAPVQTDPTRSRINAIVASSDMYLQFPFRLFGRLKGAVKYSQIQANPDPIGLTTMLLVAGSGWKPWKIFYLYGEYRFMRQFETGTNALGPTVEVGINPQEWVYIGIGYNFSRIEDTLYALDNFDREGIYARLRFTF